MLEEKNNNRDSFFSMFLLSFGMIKYLKIFCLVLMIACIVYIWAYSYSGFVLYPNQTTLSATEETESDHDICKLANSFSYEKGSNKSNFTTRIDPRILSFTQIEEKISNLSISLMIGGRGLAKVNRNCSSSRNIAFIIPYRDRLESLKIFLSNMHPILTKQNINYGIYLIEPVKNVTFNRALLLNIGFVEVIKEQLKSLDEKIELDKSRDLVKTVVDSYYNCFVFHDVDMLPEDTRLMYHCDYELPIQIAVAVKKFSYSTTGYFQSYTGGITSFTMQQYIKINGMSNLFFGWGGEDDDLYTRIHSKFRKMRRVPAEIGRIYTHNHAQDKPNPERGSILKKRNELQVQGLNTLKYQVESVYMNKLFTKIRVQYDRKDYKIK